jgi:hypothetical protein
LEKIGIVDPEEQKWQVETLCDVVRGSAEIQTSQCAHVVQFLRLFMALDDDEPDEAGYADVLLNETSIGKIVIVSVKNRWNTPSSTGWHDGLILFYFQDDENKHICELQLVHSLLNNVRKGMGAHKTYSQYRSAEELMLAIKRQLRTETLSTLKQSAEGGKAPQQSRHRHVPVEAGNESATEAGQILALKDAVDEIEKHEMKATIALLQTEMLQMRQDNAELRAAMMKCLQGL